jgi:transposase-like protein
VPSPSYKRHRFPPEIIAYAVWLYYRFALSFRDVEELLASKGVIVSYEAVRLWCGKFGPEFARRLRPCRRRLGRCWHVDEVFVRLNGVIHYLWRAVDQNGTVVDILVQARRDRAAAEPFFRHLLRSSHTVPQITSQHVNESGACAGSNHPKKHSDFFPSTARSVPISGVGVIGSLRIGTDRSTPTLPAVGHGRAGPCAQDLIA